MVGLFETAPLFLLTMGAQAREQMADLRSSEGGRRILAARQVSNHLTDDLASLQSAQLKNGGQVKLASVCVTALSDILKAETFQLLKTNMEAMYRQSSDGWAEKSKKKEMRENDMFYLLATDAGTGTLSGFATFKFDFEDGHEVIYCYELQIAEAQRQHGLGALLLNALRAIGQRAQMEKLMLTTFKFNKAAQGFFRHYGLVLGPHFVCRARFRSNPSLLFFPSSSRSLSFSSSSPLCFFVVLYKFQR